MLRKFINGLFFGAGFAIACIILLVVYSELFFQSAMNLSSEVKELSTSDVPAVSEVPKIRNEFLGAPTIYASGFLIHKSKVLSSGPGQLEGMVKSNGNPTQGLKLRLALNGEAWSQWAITNSLGEYVISVPYGDYEIDGYELDRDSANQRLAGLIDSPANRYSSGVFSVTKDQPGNGLNFSFVNPIVKTIKRASYNQIEPVIISWDPYKDAVSYSLQVYEKSSPHDYMGNNPLFSWSSRPHVSKTSVDLRNYTKDFKPGYYYTYEIRAIGEKGQQVSETARIHQGYDFKIE